MASSNGSANEMMVRIDASAGDDSAEFLAILMIVAKSFEQAQKLPDLPAEDGITLVLQLQRNLFGMVQRLYPDPGEMKRRVIAFADRMGFDIRERYFSTQSNATH
jgi:hypothetical protein